MKTTVHIADDLLARAKRHAKRSGRPLRALIEEGLQQVLASKPAGGTYPLPDRSVGDPKGEDPLESLSWEALRGEIYGGR